MSFNPDQTSKRVASESSLLLRSKSSSKTAKSVAGSALAQTPYKSTLLGGAINLRKKVGIGLLMKAASRKIF